MNHSFDIDNRTASAAQAQNALKSIQGWKTSSRAQNTGAQTGAKAIEQNFEALLNQTQNVQKPNETLSAIAPLNDETVVSSKIEKNTAPVHKAPQFQSFEEERTVAPKHKPVATAESFQFRDVIDIVNPLQHLPLISMVYRGLTGDEIKPASQIIGGGLFGGPIGALSGTANAIAQIKTGKDIPNTVMSLAGLNEGATQNQPSFQTNSQTQPNNDDPEARLNALAGSLKLDNETELPGTALAFVNLSEVGRGYIKTSMADGRTAGSQFIQKQNVNFTTSFQPVPDIETINLDTDMPAMEAMTSLNLSSMPPTRSF